MAATQKTNNTIRTMILGGMIALGSCATGHLQGKKEAPSLLRAEMETRDFRASFRGFRRGSNRYWLVYWPGTEWLTVTKYSEDGVIRFGISLGLKVEGKLDLRLMVLGKDNTLLFAGREGDSGNAVLVRGTFNFSEEKPDLEVETIMNDQGIGDITGVVEIDGLNESIAFFDYSNASLHYFHLDSGTRDSVLSPVEEPILLEMQGLEGAPLRDTTTNEISGCSLYLRENRDIPAFQSGTQVILTDHLADGAIDKVLILPM